MQQSDWDILNTLDESYIANKLGSRIYDRAYMYYRQRRVRNPRRIGTKLEAEVQGTELYRVRIQVDEGTILSSCTCPFAETAICKHIGAVLLQWVHEPDSFQVLEEEEALTPTTATKETRPQKATSLHKPPWWHEQPEAVAALVAKEGEPSSLTALLERIPLHELREIARLRGWRIKGGNKADYCAALAPLLTDPTEIARAVTSLSDPLREALRAAFVVEEGSGITSTALAQVITALRGAAGPPLKAVEAAGLLADLAHWGLLFRWHDAPDGKQRYLLPWEIQRHVPPLPGWCRQLPQAPTAQTHARKRQDILDRLYALWKRIAEHPPALRPRPQQPPPKRTPFATQDWESDSQEEEEWLNRQKRLASLQQMIPVATPDYLLHEAARAELAPLTGGDQEELEFLCRLLCELELASAERGYLLPRPEWMTQFLAYPKTKQYAAVVSAYLAMQEWSELDMLLRTDQRLALWRRPIYLFTYDQFRLHLLRLRHVLLHFLATAGEEGWCALTDLEASLRLLWPQVSTILESHPIPFVPIWPFSLWGLAWRSDGRELSGENEPDWQAAQGGFLRTLLTGPLFWLGFVELGLDNSKLVAVRLSGLADRLWDRTAPTLEEALPSEPVQIDETTHTITVHPGAVPPQAHALLGRIARLEEAAPDRFVYHLDLRTAYAAFERGESLDELLAAWDKALPVPMPSSLREVLAQWWSQYGQVRLYEGFALLEVSDDVALMELEASTPLRQHIVARLSPRLVLVEDKAVEALLQAFIEKGHTPKEVR
ncbi:MAG: helicase-associated domain-containing protein [Chloroflexi bacterium]|nr:helicase-associated domain-containing protein [Chloroflexota bacterium]